MSTRDGLLLEEATNRQRRLDMGINWYCINCNKEVSFSNMVKLTDNYSGRDTYCCPDCRDDNFKELKGI